MKKIKRKQGFTIPELLAVIVILGILVVISTTTYTGISKKLKESTLNQKINYYKEKALEYAEDNDITNKTISLSSLVEQGYIESEHPENPIGEQIDNPVNNEFLDCMNFTITKNLAEYDITYDLDGSCTLLDEEQKAQDVTIERYVKRNNNYVLINDEWVNEPVYLLVKVKNVNKYSFKDNKMNFNISGDITSSLSNKYCDTLTSTTDLNSCLNVKEVTTSYIFNNFVYVNFELIDNTNATTQQSYKIAKAIKVQIDKESPTLKYEYNSSYTKGSIKVTLKSSDGNGSGIYGYYFSSEELPSNYTIHNFVNGTENYVSENKTYYAYAIDKTGNISNREEIIINNIDRTGPQEFINYSKRNSWSADDLTVTFGCNSDNKVGCKNEITYSVYDTSNGKKTLVSNKTEYNTSVSYTFHLDYIPIKARGEGDKNGDNADALKAEDAKVNSNYISTAQIVFTIKDNVGNSKTLTYDIPVMIDKVTPVVVLRAGDRERKSSWFGLVTKGYYYNMYITVENASYIKSGVNTNKVAFSTSMTKLETLTNNPFNDWSYYFKDHIGDHLRIYTAKNSANYFTFEAVSNTGIPTYGSSVATDKSCKEYLATAAAGGLAGLGVGGFALMLFGGPVGWVLAGAAAAGAATGALLCASS